MRLLPGGDFEVQVWSQKVRDFELRWGSLGERRRVGLDG